MTIFSVVQPRAVDKKKIRRVEDLEFLPAALEMIEAPPSPIRIGLIYAISAMISLTLAWSWFGHIEVYAVATGKLQPSGRAKVVQPVDVGKVSTIRARNGDHVTEGSLLLELDSAEAAATRTAALETLKSLRAEIARRKTAVQSAATGAHLTELSVDWPTDVPTEVRTREQRVLEADIAQLRASIKSLEAQKVEKEAERDKAAASIASANETISINTERVGLYERLLKMKIDGMSVGSRLELINARNDLSQAKTQLVGYVGDQKEAVAAALALDADITKTIKTFISDNAQKLSDADQKASNTEQDFIKAEVKLSNTNIISPISGTVQASTVTTIGQVVSAGQELMHIVPDGSDLEIEAYVLNRDIGFVAAAQEAVIKVDTLPFTRYGTIKGTVVRVADDAVSGEQAQQNLRDPTQPPSGSLSLTSAAQKTQDLVFPVIVQPATKGVMADGKSISLIAGMTVTVEIKTEARRVIDYILSPLIEVGSRAMRER
jgi:hemolysin D